MGQVRETSKTCTFGVPPGTELGNTAPRYSQFFVSAWCRMKNVTDAEHYDQTDVNTYMTHIMRIH